MRSISSASGFTLIARMPTRSPKASPCTADRHRPVKRGRRRSL
jgi:hypothetical protein